ncbi:MAG: helix-turn-helix domain-containing protein [Clostridia bacterium]|nr:helix-turn-helix domain-containing protein [Clostridia bacterium]
MKETRIKELRQQKNLTQVRLAIDLNISQNTLSRYETGEREPDCAMLKKIAAYFNVSIDYLLMETDNPNRNV